jgi:L-alanine-DL-glutamate epimerase-like enolase superfamily enzyme
MLCAGLEGNHCARGAVEVALADLAGQLLGVPCATLLGGAADSVTVASMLSFGEPGEMAEEATRLHEQYGIAAFKAKVGRDVQLDVDSIRPSVPPSRTRCCTSTPTAGGRWSRPGQRRRR